MHPMPSYHNIGIIALVLLLGGACSLDLVVVAGESVDYGHAPELQPCAGNAVYVNNFAFFIEELLGLGNFGHASFSWIAEEELGKRKLRSCDGTIGCNIKSTSFSQWPIHLHEVVHSLMYSINDDPLPFLREGLATALDMPGGLTLAVLQGDGPSSADPRTELTKIESIDYYKAGLFVLYLLQRHGIEKFGELYRRAHSGISSSTIHALFLKIYGFDIDEMVNTYLSTSNCPVGTTPVPWYECSAPLLLAEDEVWIFERSVDCAAQDVRGGLESEWGIVAGATFVVTLPGIYEIELDTPTPALVHVAACGHCRWLSPQALFSGESPVTVFLADGPHFVTTRLLGREQGDVRVKISPAP